MTLLPAEVPSKLQIMKASGLALLVALIILFIAVLPAEYGIDPLHTGAALRSLHLAKSTAPPATAAAASPSPPEISAPVVTGVFSPQAGSYKSDSRQLNLRQGEGIEIKYHMQKGAFLIYSWTATSAVGYEFHGEPDVKPAGAPPDYFESYDKNIRPGKDQSHGNFTSPTTGIQGWFWLNASGKPVTIKLGTAGFYDYILQNKDNVKTRLQPSDPR